jgi:hypothetical protein
MARYDKIQEKLGIKKLEARRQRYGKIQRQEERKYDKNKSMKDNIKQKSKSLLEVSMRDKMFRGKLNPTDRRARSQYRAQLATKNWEEESQLAAADLGLKLAGRDHPEALAMALEQAKNGPTRHERDAGASELVKRRAGDALRELQAHNASLPDRLPEVNSFIGANYAELQSIDQGLTKVPGLNSTQQHLASVNEYDGAGNVTGTVDMSAVPVLQARINQSAVNLVQSKPEDLRAHIAAVQQVKIHADQIDEALLQGQFGAAGTAKYDEAKKMADSLRSSHQAAVATIGSVQAGLADPSSSIYSAAKTDAAAEIKTW